MNYLRLDDMAVVSEWAVRAALPHVSFNTGVDLTELGFAPVLPSQPPVARPGYVIESAAPVQSNGQWVDGWRERPMTQAEMTVQQAAIVATLTDAVQQHLDSKAREKNYDDIVSACSYAAVPNDFQAESQAYLTWRAACWKKCYQIMAEVQAQSRAIPTKAELLAELPLLVLP